MDLHPFPYVVDPSEEPRDGFLFSAPAFCAKANRTRCSQHYCDIVDKKGVHVCPFGYSSYVTEVDGKPLIYTGLRISGHVDRKKLKRRRGGYPSPKITLSDFEKSLRTVDEARKALLSERQRIELSTEQDAKALVNSTLHEIRKLNAEIKNQAEQVQHHLKHHRSGGHDYVDYRVDNIFNTSSLISTRLNSYDLSVNPDLLLADQKRPIGVFKKFQKIAHCMNAASRKKKISIKLSGDSHHTVDGYQFFEILPFLLVENAMKFSPENQTIAIDFYEERKSLEVVVSSYGPCLEPGEETRIFEKGYRGKYASQVASGTGAGLHLAKMICDCHDIAIDAESRQEHLVTVGSVPYCDFVVTLRF